METDSTPVTTVISMEALIPLPSVACAVIVAVPGAMARIVTFVWLSLPDAAEETPGRWVLTISATPVSELEKYSSLLLALEGSACP